MNFLIKDTTTDERRKLVSDALGVSRLGGGEPSDEIKELVDHYIDGKMELDEIQKIILENYQKKSINLC